MKLLVLYGIYEAERVIAPVALRQLLAILSGHEVDLLIQDDASPSHVGDELAKDLADSGFGRIEVRRLERSSGYRASIERIVGALGHVARGTPYDYVLRVDADVHFCRTDLAALFAPGCLPKAGVIGPIIPMRKRDFVQYLADLLPVGFRRRQRRGTIEHKWELSRARPLWWADIGRSALYRGFRGAIVAGSFQVFAWESIREIAARGWLDRELGEVGLMFGEEIVTNCMVIAAGHEVVDIKTLLPDWSCELALRADATADMVRSSGYYYVHPMKDAPGANRLRQSLSLA